MKSTVIVLLGLLLVGGCAETRTYQVSVRNDTPEPITLWLFKAGGPYEEGWKSPDDIAVDSPKSNEPIGGVIVRPGKTATAGPLKGQFNSNARAILRVYRGAHSFNELLAIGAASGDREDVPLPQGPSVFRVNEDASKLMIEPARGSR